MSLRCTMWPEINEAVLDSWFSLFSLVNPIIRRNHAHRTLTRMHTHPYNGWRCLCTHHYPGTQEHDLLMADRESEPFEQLVLAALATLPAEFTAHLRNVEVLVELCPSPDQLRALELQSWQTLYGLYQGVPLTARSHHMIVLPNTITLFQEPLERDFPNPDALREQVRRTVLHEIAHVFGISDQRLRELGAY